VGVFLEILSSLVEAAYFDNRGQLSLGSNILNHESGVTIQNGGWIRGRQKRRI
jgi:hypothetical protein